MTSLAPLPSRRLLGMLLLLPLLAACSHDSSPPIAATPAAAYTAVARGRVDVEGGLLNLGMARDGVLSTVPVHEGDQVKQGQLLATLDTEPAQLAVGAAQTQLQQAQAQIGLTGTKLAAAQVRAQRLHAAAAAGAGDGQSADDARDAATQLTAEQDAGHAAVAMATQKLTEARYELAQRSLHAPFDAVVVRVLTQPGASVSPSSGAIFTLLPNKPRIIRAELSEAYVNAVNVGMSAEVSADDDPHAPVLSAHVLRIGNVVGPSMLEDDPQQRANLRTVSCVLAFDQPQTLRIGQRVLLRFGAVTAAKPPATPAKD